MAGAADSKLPQRKKEKRKKKETRLACCISHVQTCAHRRTFYVVFFYYLHTHYGMQTPTKKENKTVCFAVFHICLDMYSEGCKERKEERKKLLFVWCFLSSGRTLQGKRQSGLLYLQMSRRVLRGGAKKKWKKKERKKEIIFYVVLSIIWMQTMGFEPSASLYLTCIQTCIEFLSHEPSSVNIVVRHVSLHTLSTFDIYLDVHIIPIARTQQREQRTQWFDTSFTPQFEHI